jgi:hypothetical protein
MRNSGRFLLIAALAVGGACTLDSSPAQARASVSIFATSAPPPLRAERMPPPRSGYVWVAGDWRWVRGRYVWHSGSWVRVRRGFHYVPSHWDRHGNRWRYSPGVWVR